MNSPLAGRADIALDVLVVTNMYPSQADITYGTFVAEQVDAIRKDPRIREVEVLFIDGRRRKWNYVRAIGALRGRVRGKRFDIVHAHHGLAGAVAVCQRTVPTVVTFHGSDLAFFRSQRVISRLAARFAAAAISVAKANQHYLRRSSHVPCGVDISAFGPRDRAAARDELGVPRDALTLLFGSHPERVQKRFDRFREISLTLQSRGRNVHELILAGVARRDVPTYMAAADVLVLPSESEGTPVVVMEALAAGLPVVAADVGDVRLMDESGALARVLPYDLAAFVNAIEAVEGGLQKRTPAVNLSRFDVRAVAGAVVDVYLHALRDDDANRDQPRLMCKRRAAT